MGLVLIQGGRAEAEDSAVPTVAAVEREAARRLDLVAFGREAAREAATGRPMPLPLRIYGLQVKAIALGLCRLEVIPDDYRADLYWPSAGGLRGLSVVRPGS
ncbi:hypothetical protein ACLE20_14950 [Rhizobium sp. YIM 134829]|uniref:hypothetical protein n=1 Tax=Rhizobium sp. YIM 134829 TaxID=3390453 RepID=UPI003979ACA4